MAQITIFYLLAFLATTCSILVISSRNPVSSAIYLVCDLFILAAIYASLNADFVAAIQVIVYTGAVVVLFLFVIMLLNLAPDQRDTMGLRLPDIGFTLLTVIAFLTMTLFLINEQHPSLNLETVSNQNLTKTEGNTHAVGLILFSKYIWPFELASFLILASIVGSVFIAKKEKKDIAQKATKQLATKEISPHGAP